MGTVADPLKSLGYTGICTIEMPKDAGVLHCGTDSMSGAEICIWAEVDPDKPKETRTFAFYGTGWLIPFCARHLATVMDYPFVWHIYELHQSPPAPLRAESCRCPDRCLEGKGFPL